MATAQVELNLWDRQSGESSPAFQAFVIFRDAGPDRKLTPVALQLKKSVALMSKWSLRHGWKRRVEAWEIYLDREAQKTLVHEHSEARRRQLQIGKSLQSKGLEGLLHLEVVRTDPNNPDAKHLRLKPAELVRLLDAGSKQIREAIGKVDQERPTKIEVIFDTYADDEGEGDASEVPA